MSRAEDRYKGQTDVKNYPTSPVRKEHMESTMWNNPQLDISKVNTGNERKEMSGTLEFTLSANITF